MKLYKILIIFLVAIFIIYAIKYLKNSHSALNPVQLAEEKFENAWNNPAYTQIRLDDVDINKALNLSYHTESPVNFTADMLWDMETKKAWSPIHYIPYVVKEGRSWGKKKLENGNEYFVRISQQKQWLNNDVYEEVFEEVYVNHQDRKITFIGTNRVQDESGNYISFNNEQPLFYVEHSVKGTKDNPVNVWRIIFLTHKKEGKLIELFQKLNNRNILPRFVEIYIENDLHIPLRRKSNSID